MEGKVRTALIGIGVMGKKYAEMIVGGKVENLSLTAVVVRRSQMLEWAENLADSEGNRPRIYRDTEELFADPDGYDAVLIVTPHKTHPEFAARAFELGKHVLCDKPAGTTIGQALRMTADSEAAGMVYGMVFHQRLYAKYRRIKEILKQGELGTISRMMLVNSRYFRTHSYHCSGSWRSSWNGEGGGALINQGAHILDIWQWLFGMPEKLYADIPFGKYNDFLVDDEATIHMRYPGNVTAVFMLTTGEAVWEERLEIVGSKGKLLLENDTLRIQRYDDSNEYMRIRQVTSREEMRIEEEIIEFPREAEPYPQMLQNFAESVLAGDARRLVAPGSSAVFQLMLTNAAYYSAWTGQPVELPLDPAVYEEAFRKQCQREVKPEA